MRGGTENNKILSNELINFAGLNGSIFGFIFKKVYVLDFLIVIEIFFLNSQKYLKFMRSLWDWIVSLKFFIALSLINKKSSF